MVIIIIIQTIKINSDNDLPLEMHNVVRLINLVFNKSHDQYFYKTMFVSIR